MAPLDGLSSQSRFVRLPISLNEIGVQNLITLGLFENPQDLRALYTDPNSNNQNTYYGFLEDATAIQRVLDRLDVIEPLTQPVPNSAISMVHLPTGQQVPVPNDFLLSLRTFLVEHQHSLTIPDCETSEQFRYLPQFARINSQTGQPATNEDIFSRGQEIDSFTPPLGSVPLPLGEAQAHWQRYRATHPDCSFCRTPLTVTLADFQDSRGFIPTRSESGRITPRFQTPYLYAIGEDLLHTPRPHDPRNPFAAAQHVGFSANPQVAETLAAIGLLQPGDHMFSLGEDAVHAGQNRYAIPRQLTADHKERILQNLRSLRDEGTYINNAGEEVSAEGLHMPPDEVLNDLITVLDDGLKPPDETKSAVERLIAWAGEKWYIAGPLGFLGTVFMLLLAFKWGPEAWDALSHRYNLPRFRDLIRDTINWDSHEARNFNRDVERSLAQPIEGLLARTDGNGIRENVRITTVVEERSLLHTGEGTEVNEDPLALRAAGHTNRSLPQSGSRLRDRLPNWMRPHLQNRLSLPEPLSARTLAYDLGDGSGVRLALYNGEEYPTSVTFHGTQGDPGQMDYEGRHGTYAVYRRGGEENHRLLVGPANFGHRPEIIVPGAEENLAVTTPPVVPYEFGPRVLGDDSERFQLRFAEGPNHHPTTLRLTRGGQDYELAFQGYLPTTQGRSYWGQVGVYGFVDDPHADPLYLTFSKEGRGWRPLVSHQSRDSLQGRPPWFPGFRFGFEPAPGTLGQEAVSFDSWEAGQLRVSIEAEGQTQRRLVQDYADRAATLLGRESPAIDFTPYYALEDDDTIDWLRGVLAEQRFRTGNFRADSNEHGSLVTRPTAEALGIGETSLTRVMQLGHVHDALAPMLWRNYTEAFYPEALAPMPPSLVRPQLPEILEAEPLNTAFRQQQGLLEAFMTDPGSPQIEQRLQHARMEELNWRLTESTAGESWPGPESHLFLGSSTPGPIDLEILNNNRIALERRVLGTANLPAALLRRPFEGLALTTQVDPPQRSRGRTEPLRALDPLQYPNLTRFTTDVTLQAQEGRLDPIIGRNFEIRQAIEVLNRRTKSNAALLGEAGVGKSAIEEALAQRMIAQDVPPFLQQARLLRWDIAAMVAGTTLRGEFEDRLKQTVAETRALNREREAALQRGEPYYGPWALTSIDEVHMVVGAGDSNGGAMDASNILKPEWARGLLPSVVMTTSDEFRQHISSDPALERRFQSIHVLEPAAAQALAMLEGRSDLIARHNRVQITPEARAAAIFGSISLMPDRNLPDKGIDLLELAASRAGIQADTQPYALADGVSLGEDNQTQWRAVRDTLYTVRDLQILIETKTTAMKAALVDARDSNLTESEQNAHRVEAQGLAHVILSTRQQLEVAKRRLAQLNEDPVISWPTGQVGQQEIVDLLAEQISVAPEHVTHEIAERRAFEGTNPSPEDRQLFELHRGQVARIMRDPTRRLWNQPIQGNLHESLSAIAVSYPEGTRDHWEAAATLFQDAPITHLGDVSERLLEQGLPETQLLEALAAPALHAHSGEELALLATREWVIEQSLPGRDALPEPINFFYPRMEETLHTLQTADAKRGLSQPRTLREVRQTRGLQQPWGEARHRLIERNRRRVL
jgi:hypothetical protein